MDKHTKEQRSRNMKAVKSKGSKMETILINALLDKGLIFDTYLPSIEGKPDIVFLDKKVVVFCDSEFFHGKDWEIKKNEIKSHQDFWLSKIERNIERDKQVDEVLQKQGYKVIRFWENEIIKNTDTCVEKIIRMLINKYEITENETITVSDPLIQEVIQFEKVPFPAPKNPKFKFIDLFAGIGGFRIAFQNLGGECVFSSEIDTYAQKSYQANFGEISHGDITKIDEKNIPDHDILTGGFPCQAFSIAGRRGGFEDTRGTLFFDVARIIKEKSPKAFFLENVKGLISHNKGKTLETILNVLRNELDYFVPNPQVMNAKNFGVPQNRERIFIVGFRKDQNVTDFEYPEPTNNTIIFEDVREKHPVSSKYYLSSQYLNTLKAHRTRHESKGNGFGYIIIPNDGIANAIVVGGMGKEKNLVYDDRITDFTPQTKIKSEINKEYIRRMTPREWARLQGFPDKFKIIVADVQAYKQFGNSVAVPAIQATAGNLIAKLKL
jgi:DNA (cytosine-5)-methyltransferase 1